MALFTFARDAEAIDSSLRVLRRVCSQHKKPGPERMTLLEQFFYRAGTTYRYSSATESKMAEDLVRIDAIVGGKTPKLSLG